MRKASILAAVAVLVLTDAVAAEDSPAGLLTALTAGVLLHDPGGANEESESVDFQGELRFRSLPFYDGESAILKVLLRPQPTAGLSINSGFDTNYVYAGVSWPIELGAGFFLMPFFGGMLHDGNVEDSSREPELGSHLLFREAIDLGYRFAGRHALAVSASHVSNAGLADENEGMNFVGLRYSYFLQ